MFDAAVIFGHRFRYQASGAVTDVIITSGNLVNALVMALTATTTAPIASAVKIKRVSLWGPPSSTLTPVTVSLEFVSTVVAAASVGTRPTLISDTSVGATRVAFVSAKPAKQSSAAMWQVFGQSGVNTSGAAFRLNGPTGMIVDIEIVLVVQNGESPQTGPTTTGATPGAVYSPKLDFTGAGLLVPTSYRALP